MNEPNENSKMKPLAVILVCILYIVSPIDFLPDFVPIAGWLDDIGVLGFLVHTYTAYKKQVNGQSLASTEPSETVIIDAPFTTLEYKDS